VRVAAILEVLTTITKLFRRYHFIKCDLGLGKFDHNNRMIAVSVITVRDFFRKKKLRVAKFIQKNFTVRTAVLVEKHCFRLTTPFRSLENQNILGEKNL